MNARGVYEHSDVACHRNKVRVLCTRLIRERTLSWWIPCTTSNSLCHIIVQTNAKLQEQKMLLRTMTIKPDPRLVYTPRFFVPRVKIH